MSPSAPTEAASLLRPPDAGRIVGPMSPLRADLSANGYVEEELFASGTASAFAATGPLGTDGRWAVEPSSSAPYATRIVVRRPGEGRPFSGTVLVEWCNVSGGVEADPDWAFVHQEVMRAGHAYVAVSVQALGVDGGVALLDVPGVQRPVGLVGSAPERYGSLHHPGDAFAFDMFSQVGAALRGAGDPSLLGGLRPQRLIAVGESQSAFFLTTYVDAVHPLAGVYDGFLVHSRGGAGASLDGTVTVGDTGAGLRIRDDLDDPVLVFATETDVGPLLDYVSARQPDTEHVRTWEVAGTAHADAYLVGPFASALGCGLVNDGPQHFVMLAAVHALEEWVARGTPPPSAPALALASTGPTVIARDDFGNAVGGVRTPDVDVPVAALSGDPLPDAGALCALFGSTTPFDGATLTRLYGSRQGYLAAYERRLDEVIGEGFLLGADRDAILARAEGVAFPD